MRPFTTRLLLAALFLACIHTASLAQDQAPPGDVEEQTAPPADQIEVAPRAEDEDIAAGPKIFGSGP